MPAGESLPAFDPMHLPSATDCDVRVSEVESLDAFMSLHALDVEWCVWFAGMTISEVESTGAGPLIPILASIIWIPVGMVGLMLALQSLLAIGNGNSWFENRLMDIGVISLPLA